MAVAQAIHAIIKANDALAVRFLRRRSTRHEDAAAQFKELVRRGTIPAKQSRWRDLLVQAVAEKSDYDYKGAEVGLKEARRWVRDADLFLGAVRVILEAEH